MKKIYILNSLAAVLFFVGCSDDANTPQSGQMVVRAEGQTTRTVLNAEDGAVYWNAGDEISIFNKNGNVEKYTSTLAPGQSNWVSEFMGTVLPADTYYALYPHNATNSADYAAQTITFTYTQGGRVSGESMSFIDGAFPSVAEFSDFQRVVFRNLFGIARFRVTGEGQISKISIECVDNSVMLNGTCTVDMSDPELPVSISGGTNIIDLEMPTDSEGNYPELSMTVPTIFTFAVPPTPENSLFNLRLTYANKGGDGYIVSNIPYHFKRNTLANFTERVEMTTMKLDDLSATTYPIGPNWDINIEGAENIHNYSSNLSDAVNAAVAAGESSITINMKGVAYCAYEDVPLFVDAKDANPDEPQQNFVTLDLTEAVFIQTSDGTAMGTNRAENVVPRSFAKNYKALKSLVLSKDISAIFRNAFDGCSSLTSVTYGAGKRVPTRTGRVEADAFNGCAFVLLDLSWANTFGHNIIAQNSRLLSLNLSAPGDFYELDESGNIVAEPTFTNVFAVTQTEDYSNKNVSLTLFEDKEPGSTVIPSTTVSTEGELWAGLAWKDPISYLE